MIFLAITYHYAEEEGKYPYPGIYPVTAVKLKSQLAELGKYFEFISETDLLKALDKKNKLPLRCCLVTLDDGLKCQYENALPLLKKMRIPAIFFVNTKPLLEHRALSVHKIHYLRSHIEPAEFLKEIESAYFSLKKKKIIIDSAIQEKAVKAYPYDEKGAGCLKFLLNFFWDTEFKEKIIGSIFGKYIKNEKYFCSNFYMSSGEILDISRRENYSIGTHTHSHYPLKNLTSDILRDEVEKSIKCLVNIGVKNIFSISYPYGGPDAVSKEVASLAKSLGLNLGFTTESAFNKTLKHPLLLARMDTNDVLGGKSPAFFFKNNKLCAKL